MTRLRRLLVVGLFLAMTSPTTLEDIKKTLFDLPYVVLTGFSHEKLEKLSYLPEDELREKLGFEKVPGGFTGEFALRGRGAHAIASYLGTRRWGPNITLAFGYLKEYVPALLKRGKVDPVDIAANYAGIDQALREMGRR